MNFQVRKYSYREYDFDRYFDYSKIMNGEDADRQKLSENLKKSFKRVLKNSWEIRKKYEENRREIRKKL